jgi:hypothetical protein
MNKSFKVCLAGAAFLASMGQARANVLIADLNQIAFSVPSFVTSVGTVQVTDHVGYVDVLVTMNNGATFINTGGPHTPFVYNLDHPTTATSVTPAPFAGGPLVNIGTPKHPNYVHSPSPTPGFGAAVGSQSETPYGSFTNGIAYVNADGSSAANGGGHGNAGPLDFHLLGITTYDFMKNANGYYFGADVIACTGIAGVSCATGGVAANHITISGVPEPSTWAMMVLGFAGIGLMMYRRKNKSALSAA